MLLVTNISGRSIIRTATFVIGAAMKFIIIKLIHSDVGNVAALTKVAAVNAVVLRAAVLRACAHKKRIVLF